MKNFISRFWPQLILLLLVTTMVLRANYVHGKAQLASCGGSSQTLVVDYFAVPYLQSAVSCRNN